jgi:hypothetical protein
VIGTLTGIRIFTWYCPLRRLEMFFLTFLSVSFLQKEQVNNSKKALYVKDTKEGRMT